MEAISPGTGSLPPDFAGIDPELMQGFITALERGRDVIGEQTERIRQLLATAEVPAEGLLPLREIDGWVSDELLGLRNRLQTINQDLPMLGVGVSLPGQTSAWTGGQPGDPFQWGLLPYDEKTGKSPAGSAKEGTELAFQLSRLPPSTLGLPDAAYDRILGKLADGQQDAYLTAGFFRVLGPEGMLGMIQRLERYDKKAGDQHRKVIGDALATAVGAQPGLLGSAWEAGNLKKAPDGELASLLRYGMFPAAWLTEIARGRVGKPVGDGDGTRPRRWKTDLVPLLPALANNPDVARGLFNAMSREDLRDLLTELNRPETSKIYKTPWFGLETPKHPWRWPTSVDFDIGAEFGRMLAAGGGAYEKGPHSPEAAKFAFNVMTIMGDLKDTDGTEDSPATPMEVAPAARIYMSTLAGAYATEITEGANIGDANMTEASTLKPFTSAFGTTAAFTLSPKDTYNFLKTFADSAKNLAPFDQGMGRFSQQLIADASATARRTGDVEHLDKAFTALGNVRGFELAAVEKVQGNLDMIDKQRKDTVNFLRDAAIGLASTLYAPNLVWGFGWLALSTSLSAEGAFGKEDETRMDKANKDDRAATLSRQHTYAQLLMANGFTPKVTAAEFQASCPPGVSIIDAKGNLRPFAELIKQGNKGLESFERWAVANGMGSEAKLSLGRLSNDTASWFEGSNKRGRERALAFDS
ncbi:hypothetical protein OG884_07570 [Streptosporangium sp. NBC_01755]|uniref:hypothetical protein n=1 Tax=Streptosporangium sp. NBC_01755 TaxID=2975949 RepID=UPI002DDB7451|nr:hypothetical protein [Streptosporangium sp. NBC_01755]WSD01771.1 hypothetical protein OG884_07570 [Streptosporangium sp. NBC_01755]